MVYVISDGSLNSNMMPDTSTAGRGKLGWQGDNSSVASTFFLVYSPKGRPTLLNGVAGQQIGYFTAAGNGGRALAVLEALPERRLDRGGGFGGD